MSNTKDYYIGFDLGTNSVGWAVTDKNYKLLRKKGKDLWGVREFDSAKGAIERRTKRISRRRRLREVARIGMLNSFFADEIAKVDKEFLQRLKESKYNLEDKKVESKYTLFADKDYTDKDYFKEYPTIFHLRKSLLLEENKKFDIRFIYLAILNMFKHRGHFLNDIAGDGAEDSIDNLYTELVEKTSFIDDENQFKYLEDVSVLYFDKSLKKQESLDYLSELLGIRKNKDKKHYEILKSLVGMKFELKTIFSLEDSKKISFRENSEENFSDILSGEQIELLDLMNKIHDNIYLSSIMKSHKYLSLARVEDYEKHKKDLEILKKYIKENVPEKYDSIFRVMEKGSYSAYVGSVNSDKGKVRRGVKDSSGEELINNIKKILKNLEDSKEKAY
ncbi:MAG: type II CRISPR RNA-guided endonuclease Cas9, partial [Tyzzerella sp.]|nr:type II CRISPR RNA-guided endonuclease Cas9 [Candidatus Fimicola merdigallinarum]